MRRENVQNYIQRVKQSNPNGVVLCIDTEEGTQEKVKTDGAFNVYFQMGEKVFIDFLGKGFDMGAITKGKENHEAWIIDWEDILFATPNNMNQYRQRIISDTDYLESAKRRLEHLLKLGYTREQIKGKIPKHYSSMPLYIREKLLDDIVLPIYLQRGELAKEGLKSFGVQGMILGGELFPIEFNRQVRMAEKSFFKKDNNER